MTRTRTITKTGLRKRSSTFDLQGSKKNLTFRLAASSPPPSASCLNNLFSDLSVTRTKSKRLWGNITARSQRCAHLASLVEQTTVASTVSGTSTASSSLSPSSSASRSSSSVSLTASSNEKRKTSGSDSSPNSPTTTISCRSFPVVEFESCSSWGFFVEAEEEKVPSCA
jgi:hypothetical protein